ncbi:S41 family peptidase [Nibrella saemangeumensis]
MKKIALWLMVAGCWMGAGFLSASAQTLSPEQAHEDLLFLKHKLDILHPGLGYYTPKARVEQIFDSLYNHINAPVDYLGFFHHVSPLISTLKDGHTNLNHRKNFIDKSTRFVPFYIREADGKYYISHNMSADTSLRRGTELVTLNGRTLGDLHRLLMDVDRSGSDGDNLTGRKQWSLIQFADYYASWFGSTDSIAVQYRLPTDTLLRQTKLACPTAATFRSVFQKRYRNEIDRRPNLSVRMVDTLTRTAVLRVSTFMGPKKYDPLQIAFKKKLKQAFQQIQDQKVENLILDVQNNGGGVVLNSARLLQYWMPKPFRIMEHEQMKVAARRELVNRWNPLSAIQFSLLYKKDGYGGFSERATRRQYRPRKHMAFKGNLYFLMNGGSFSATTSVLSKTLDAGMGTYVGEACGGAYWGDFAGHFKTVTLPNSRLQVRIPLKKLTHAVNPGKANGFNVEPDFTVGRTYEDVLSGRDYMLNYTLNLIRDGIVVRKPLTTRPLQALR